MVPHTPDRLGPNARRSRCAHRLDLLGLRRSLRILAVNLLLLALLLALAEAGTRLLGLRFSAIPRPGEDDRGLWVQDPSKGWFHAAGSVGENDRGGPDRGTIHINALGLRGREIAVAKEPGSFRVLVFGDSFIFGVGVDEEHLFSAALARRLRAASVRRPDVVNMGVSGYSTDQELILYRELGSRMQADLVLVAVCDNDLDGNGSDFIYKMYPKPYFEGDVSGTLVVHNQPVPELTHWQRAKVWLGRESNLWNAFRTRSSRNPLVQRGLAFFQVGGSRPAPADLVGLTAALLGAFARDVEKSGARFFAFDVGARGQDDAAIARLRARLAPDVRFLDAGERLAAARAARPGANWDFAPDTHWNVDGHRVAADAAFAELLAAGALPLPASAFPQQAAEGVPSAKR